MNGLINQEYSIPSGGKNNSPQNKSASLFGDADLFCIAEKKWNQPACSRTGLVTSVS